MSLVASLGGLWIPPDGVGWQVIDPDGNVVASGPRMIAHLDAGILEVPTWRES